MVSREPATPLRDLNPADDPFNFLDNNDVRVTFNDEVAPPVCDLTGDFQDEAAVEPRPRQQSPPPALRRSTRDRRPNRKFKGDEWTNFQTGRYATQRMQSERLNSQFLQSLDWKEMIDALPERSWKAMMMNLRLHTDESGLVDWMDPFAFASKANDEGTPNWHQAVNGPNSDGFWEAMATAIFTFTEKWTPGTLLIVKIG